MMCSIDIHVFTGLVDKFDLPNNQYGVTSERKTFLTELLSISKVKTEFIS